MGDVDDLGRVVDLVAAWEATDAFAQLGASRLTPHGSCTAPTTRASLPALPNDSTSTYFHQAGTCRMGPDGDPDAVLDPELRVRGIHGLRVADASSIPTIVRGNTYLGCVMVAEHLVSFMR